MHDEAKHFLETIRRLFPEYFKNKRVIDIGSGDINGNNKYLFENCEYIGVDVVQAPNVDLVCSAKDIPTTIGQFDVVISSECFEHNLHLHGTFDRIIRLLKPCGLFVFTCANYERPEHGTKRSSSDNSYSVNLNSSEWYPNYYRNISMDDITKIFNLQDYFVKVYFEENKYTHDLYFYGIRNNNTNYESSSYIEETFNRYSLGHELFQAYAKNYDKILRKYLFQNIKILKIGPYGFLPNTWRDVFRNAVKIIYLTTDSITNNSYSSDDGIYVNHCDFYNQNVIDTVSKMYGNFDIIIDDTMGEDNIKIFETCYYYLNGNGTYIIDNSNSNVLSYLFDKIQSYNINDNNNPKQIEFHNSKQISISK